MPSEQKTTRRISNGEEITETEGKSFDDDSSLAVQDSQRKAMASMTSGAKPERSEEDPGPNNPIGHMAWKRRQDAREAGQKKALNSMGSGH